MSFRLIQNGHILTQNKKREHFKGDILISGSQIKKIARNIRKPKNCEVIDATNMYVIPGLIQAHTHLCQTLFRGLADDMSLLDWLKKRIWPLEAAHTYSSLKASAELGLLEMQLLGTTSVLDMGTVYHTDALFESAKKARVRYWGGKCLMDLKKFSGPLYQNTRSNLSEMEVLIKKWHKTTELLSYAISPRFAVSCSEELLQSCVRLQKKYDLLLHTHASENEEEVQIIKDRTNRRNVDYFNYLTLLNKKTILAHGIHLSKKELNQMAKKKASICHCPSSNLKLASGVADIDLYLKKKINVAIGNDGAPCNNSMDPFRELRLAALLQKPKHGPKALPAQKAFDLATLGGAKALNMEKKIGSLEEAKFADIVCVSKEHPSLQTTENPYSNLVYAATGRDVRHVMIHGQIVVKNSRHKFLNERKVITNASKALLALKKRTTFV